MVFTLVLTYKPGTVVDEVDWVSDILEKKIYFLTKVEETLGKMILRHKCG